MNFNDVKRVFESCPDLNGLDEGCCSALFWRATGRRLSAGTIVYDQGTKLDNTFCLLVAGELGVERDGEAIGRISPGQIFGEVAYFTSTHERNATVRALAESYLLEFHLSPEELRNSGFLVLKKHLALQAWDRFVSDSKDV